MLANNKEIKLNICPSVNPVLYFNNAPSPIDLGNGKLIGRNKPIDRLGIGSTTPDSSRLMDLNLNKSNTISISISKDDLIVLNGPYNDFEDERTQIDQLDTLISSLK